MIDPRRGGEEAPTATMAALRDDETTGGQGRVSPRCGHRGASIARNYCPQRRDTRNTTDLLAHNMSSLWRACKLVLLLSLLLPNCLGPLNHHLNLLQIVPAQAAIAASNDDGDADQPAENGATTMEAIDNFTQIPTRTSLATTSTTRRPPAAAKRQLAASASNSAPAARISEAELIPFADFNVQQPAFGDLMRSWPPTTSAAHHHNNQQHQNRQQQQHNRGHLGASAAARQRQLQQQQQQPEAADEAAQLQGRNQLNEDQDDTSVTADQGFERDQLPEPPTWINYLHETGDFIYLQLKHYYERLLAGSSSSSSSSSSSPQQELVMQAVEEQLDDRYYDQYENSQVLYYGPQLVREGDLLEIGCYMPPEQPAEWTKSGRPLASPVANPLVGSPRAIRRTDFLGAKLNFSLKIFEATPSDSGNYRCNKMSRKYHKLVVVPLKTSTAQLYAIQQRLLAVVNPRLVSSASALAAPWTPLGAASNPARPLAAGSARFPILAGGGSSASRSGNGGQQRKEPNAKAGQQHLLPGHLIVEGEPLAVNCNISDELVLRRLREQPQFLLSWYKNGKLLKASSAANRSPPSQSMAPIVTAAIVGGRRSSSMAQTPLGGHLVAGSGARLQFLLANGRQLYISSAQYSDAGEYLCSWSKLGAQQSHQRFNQDQDQNQDESQQEQTALGGDQQNPLAAGSLVQLMAPVKLRPFKSAYHVRQGHQLRLVCQVQRGFPAALVSWYVGNRLVDADFLREHEGQFRLLQLQADRPEQVLTLGGPWENSGSQQQQQVGGRQVVEINPIPLSRQQMSLTVKGRWVEYGGDPQSGRLAIDTPDQQLAYLRHKLAQLTGASAMAGGQQQLLEPAQAALAGQAGVSVLVVNALDLERHTSRYACRATSRANTDEVTTVVRVQASSTISVRPTSGRATLIPGQPLHFECSQVDNARAEFFWFRRPLGNETSEERLEPDQDDSIEIHNERLTLLKPTVAQVADYICRAIKRDSGPPKEVDPEEFAVIKVRTQPYIEDFGLDTGHSGKSSVITDGDRLVLTCSVYDKSTPVNITWLRSIKQDDDRAMVPVPETENDRLEQEMTAPPAPNSPEAQYYLAPDKDIVVQRLDSHSKRLTIEQVRHDHRSYYVCIADNGVTERAKKIIFIRVKDKLIALWPFLGIVAELFILFTIIHIWETQKAYKEISDVGSAGATGGAAANKRPASGASATFESVPLTNG